MRPLPLLIVQFPVSVSKRLLQFTRPSAATGGRQQRRSGLGDGDFFMLAAGYFADSPIVILFTVERLYVHHHAVSAYAFILFVRIPKFDESGFEFIETSI